MAIAQITTDLQGSSPTQREIRRILVEFFNERGYFPTYRQIMKKLGHTSPSGVQLALDVMEKQGIISRERINPNNKSKGGPKRITGVAGYKIVLQKLEGE